MNVWVFIVFFFTSSAVWATDRYISPSGSGSSCTSSSPCSFTTARNATVAGDRIIVKNGLYSLSSRWEISCGVNAANGTAGSPITLMAENERQAHLAGNGSDDTLVIRNCSYWTIKGLEISSADYGTYTTSNGLGQPLSVCLNYHTDICDHITLQRNVFHHANRMCNCHLVFMANTTYALVEENEFYYFVRHGINVNGGSNNVLRRNYYNDRGYPSLANGVPTNIGGEGFTLYPSDNNIAENEIQESVQCLEILAAPGRGSNNNSVYGSICLNGDTGINTYSYGNSEAAMSKNNRYENVVVINPRYAGLGGLNARNVRGLTIKNFMVIGGAPGLQADRTNGTCCAPFSITLENVLITGASGGFSIDTSNYSYTLSKVNVYNSGANTPSSSFTTTNPNLGSCRVFIPDASPMKGQGTGGADIGANILYRYQNGVLTNQPLWDPTTGRFPHGATIAGLNDVAGQSAFDVHQRLNVNANGCSLPAGYGGSTGLNAPTSLVVTPG